VPVRRLALVFAILASISAIEQIVLTDCNVIQAQRRVRRALTSLAQWRAFLIGPLRVLQRTTSAGSEPWLGLGN
jgi:hypothetical protein